MKRFAALLLATLAATLLAPAAIVAQPAAEVARSDPYSQLYAAMEAGVDQQQVLDTMVNATALQMAQADPAIRDLEKAYPGTLRAMVAAMRPVIAGYSERVRLEYRPRMIEAIGDVLSAEEAEALAGFYSSPVGQRILQVASTSYSVSNVTEQHIDGEQVSAAAVARDMQETARRGVARMSAADLAELGRVTMTMPGFDKLPLMQQRIAPIRAEMENAPPTAEEEAAIIAAVERAVRETTR